MEEREKRKILLIDDDTSLLVTLSDFLRFEGYEVTTSESGEQGLKKIARSIPDLIILDMSMPGMGGIGFLKAISDEDGKPKYPVLVLTARANMAEFFANVDVDGFVAKPCSPEDLLMEVGRILFLRSGRSAEGERRQVAPARKVLLAEDDEEVARRVGEALTEAGFVVSTAGRGPDAIEQAILRRPDILVIKQILSKMNGDAVAEMLHEMPNTRDIAIVLYDDSGRLGSQSRPSGVSRVVLSSEPAALVTAVRAVATA